VTARFVVRAYEVSTLFLRHVITYKCFDGRFCSRPWRFCALIRPGVASAPQFDLCLTNSPRFSFPPFPPFSFSDVRSSPLTLSLPSCSSHPHIFSDSLGIGSPLNSPSLNLDRPGLVQPCFLCGYDYLRQPHTVPACWVFESDLFSKSILAMIR
jgi:hypothetical protein